MANTTDTMGDAATLDALVAGTLTTLEDDRVTRVCDYGLAFRPSLAEVALPSCAYVGAYALRGDAGLESLRLAGPDIEPSALVGCGSLAHLALTSPTVATHADMPDPIRYRHGAVYVPEGLVASYEADPDWGQHVILPLSEYPRRSFEVEDTWAQIAEASADGTYAERYGVGDLKRMEIGGQEHWFRLAAMDADALASDAARTAPMTWLSFDRVYATRQMNASSRTAGGWASCGMRAWLEDEVLPLMPPEVRSAVKAVRKLSDGYEGTSVAHDQASDDRLWVPSAREVLGGTAYEQAGPVYPRMLGLLMRGRTGSPAVAWWTRSARSSTGYACVSSSGQADEGNASSALGVAIGLCI